jgi:hypothetical protein
VKKQRGTPSAEGHPISRIDEPMRRLRSIVLETGQGLTDF